MFKESQYYTTNPDKSLQCNICPRNCKFTENGQRGFCFVRGRKDDKIGLMKYGYVSALAIDPIEKKPLYHFLPGTKVLSFGTIGCNMGCLFCQNWQLSRGRDEDDIPLKLLPKDVPQMAIKENCPSVAYTYNEPIILYEYTRDCAIKCREKGIKNIAVTAGYINPKPRKEFFNLMDAANVDLKGFSEEFYKKIVQATLKPVLNTIEYIKNKTNCWLEITNLLIPGENDDDKMIKDMCKWIKKILGTDVPLHFSAFYPCFKMMNTPPTPLKTLLRAKDIAVSEGLKHIYVGNLQTLETSATYCEKCGKKVISRPGFMAEKIKIKKGKCECGNKVAGVFA